LVDQLTSRAIAPRDSFHATKAKPARWKLAGMDWQGRKFQSRP